MRTSQSTRFSIDVDTTFLYCNLLYNNQDVSLLQTSSCYQLLYRINFQADHNPLTHKLSRVLVVINSSMEYISKQINKPKNYYVCKVTKKQSNLKRIKKYLFTVVISFANSIFSTSLPLLGNWILTY